MHSLCFHPTSVNEMAAPSGRLCKHGLIFFFLFKGMVSFSYINQHSPENASWCGLFVPTTALLVSSLLQHVIFLKSIYTSTRCTITYKKLFIYTVD